MNTMISSIEHYFEPAVLTPYYVTTTNMVAPVLTINMKVICEYIDKFATAVILLVRAMFSEINELVTVVSKHLTEFYMGTFEGNHHVALLFFVGISLSVLALCDNINMVCDNLSYVYKYHNSLVDKIKTLEQEVQTLNDANRTYNNEVEVFVRVMKNNAAVLKTIEKDMNFKFKLVEKKMKKMNKQITEYA